MFTAGRDFTSLFQESQSTAVALEWAAPRGDEVPVPSCSLRLPPPDMPVEVVRAGAGGEVVRVQGPLDSSLAIGLGVHTMTTGEFYGSHVFPNMRTMSRADVEVVALKV